MKIFGRDISLKYFLWYYCFNGLIIMDMFLISIALIFQIPEDVALDIQFFDLLVCIILLGEYALNLCLSSPKKRLYTRPYEYTGFNCFHSF